MPNASYGMWPVPSTHSFPVERRCWRSQRLRSCAYHGFEMLFKVQIWNSFPGHQLSHGNLCAFWGCCRWQLKYHPVDLLLRFQWCVWFPLHWRLTGLSSVPQMTCCHLGDAAALLIVTAGHELFISPVFYQHPLDLDLRDRHQLLEIKVIQSSETISSPLWAQFGDVLQHL